MSDEEHARNHARDMILGLADVVTEHEADLTATQLAALEMSIMLVHEAHMDEAARGEFVHGFETLEWRWESWRVLDGVMQKRDAERSDASYQDDLRPIVEDVESETVDVPGPLDLSCPYCKASEGEECRSSSGRVASYTHAARPVSDAYASF